MFDTTPFIKRLKVQPNDVEETTELQEMLNTIDQQVDPLQLKIDEMKKYFDVLDKFDYRISVEQSNAKWNNVAWPSKITQQCVDSANVILSAKEKYLNDMLSEQKRFEER